MAISQNTINIQNEFNKQFDAIFNLVPLPVPSCVKCKNKQEEKEDTMNNDKDIETRQRDHMLRRAEKIHYFKENDGLKTFHIVDDVPPENFADLKARIKTGKYILDEKADELKYGMTYAVQWRDPHTPADKPGFEAFQNLLRKEYINTKDKIIVLPVADGLKALQAFEAETVQ